MAFRAYVWQHVAMGTVVLLVTLVGMRPGEVTVPLGSVGVDLFYLLLVAEVALLALSGYKVRELVANR